jgi:hypothetical protein
MFMDRVAPVVDATIKGLAAKKFIEDPIASKRDSRTTSIVSSAYKRHGAILETALRESLAESNRHVIWTESAFKVSRSADALAGSQNTDACVHTTLPYGESVRTLQMDLLVYDHADRTIRSYEVKRGNGAFDAGKQRSIRRDMMCSQMLLKSYGETLSHEPAAAESKIIFYYGLRSIPAPWSLAKEDLDDHFGFPVTEKIEQANDYFRVKLHDLLDS